MKKHTPTPWEYGGNNSRAIYGNDGYEVAKMHLPPLPFGADREEMAGNARFIVRACNSHKRLLEACKAIVALADGQGRLNMLEVAGMARQAIEKAEVKP
mgnify:FL=1